MPSIRSRLANSVLRQAVGRYVMYGEDRDIGVRRARADLLSRTLPVPAGTTVSSVRIGAMRGEWVAGRGAREDRVMLWLHGGGYGLGTLRQYRGLASRLSSACGVRVLVPEYRLAPEHRFPAAVDDAMQAWRWLLSQGYSGNAMIIAGDSAGGGLTLACTLALRDAGDPLPAALVALSPWTDLTGSGESLERLDGVDVMLDRGSYRFFSKLYLGEHDPTDPLASPVFGDFHGMPPMLVHVSDAETLLSDALRVSDRAREDGVDVTLDVWEGMPHVWHSYAHLIPEGALAIEQVGGYVRGRLRD